MRALLSPASVYPERMLEGCEGLNGTITRAGVQAYCVFAPRAWLRQGFALALGGRAGWPSNSRLPYSPYGRTPIRQSPSLGNVGRA